VRERLRRSFCGGFGQLEIGRANCGTLAGLAGVLVLHLHDLEKFTPGIADGVGYGRREPPINDI